MLNVFSCCSVSQKTSLCSKCLRGRISGWWAPSVCPWLYTSSFFMSTLCRYVFIQHTTDQTKKDLKKSLLYSVPPNSLSTSAGDLPDSSSVLVSVGGGAEDVTSCYFLRWGTQVSRPQLRWPRESDPGQQIYNTSVLLEIVLGRVKLYMFHFVEFFDSNPLHFTNRRWRRSSWREKSQTQAWSVAWWNDYVTPSKMYPGRSC